MKYLSRTFTLPVCTRRMTDEEWDRAVGNVKPKRRRRKVKPEPKEDDGVCACGVRTDGFWPDDGSECTCS